MRVVNVIAWILLVVGGIAWLLIGAFSWNVVTALTGGMEILYRLIYVLVGISALWLLVSPILGNGKISLWNSNHRE